MMIPLAQIDFMPTGLRRSAEPDAAFVESIRNQGVLQPVLLRPAGNRFEVVKGERRVQPSAYEPGLRWQSVGDVDEWMHLVLS